MFMIGYFLLSDLSLRQKNQAIIQYRIDRFRAAQNRPPREGPGENGEGVVLTKEEKYANEDRNFKASFNVYASEKIAMDRSIPDTRREEQVIVPYAFSNYIYIYIYVCVCVCVCV